MAGKLKLARAGGDTAGCVCTPCYSQSPNPIRSHRPSEPTACVCVAQLALSPPNRILQLPAAHTLSRTPLPPPYTHNAGSHLQQLQCPEVGALLHRRQPPQQRVHVRKLQRGGVCACE